MLEQKPPPAQIISTGEKLARHLTVYSTCILLSWCYVFKQPNTVIQLTALPRVVSTSTASTENPTTQSTGTDKLPA